MDSCRVSKHYPLSLAMEGEINYVARLDGGNPVKVTYNYFVKDWCFGIVLNVYDIILLYNKYVPSGEDWFVNYENGVDFEESLRCRNVKKYSKGIIYSMLLRLCEHKIIKCFSRKDIIKHSWKGEVNSFFRPSYPIHVCMGDGFKYKRYY